MYSLQIILASICVISVSAGGYGGGGGGSGKSAEYSSSGGGGGYGGGGSSYGSGGGGRFMSFGGGFGSSLGGGGGVSSGAGQVVPAAIQTRHNVEFRDVPSSGNVNPTIVEVGANSVPLQILFRSSSSSLNVQQAHESATGGVQESSSEDEPHRLIHSVKKPIIQEVHEVITPFRKITQEIQPVQEEIQTIVARGTGSTAGAGAGVAAGASYGSSFGSGLGGGLSSSGSYKASSGSSFKSSSGGASYGSGGSVGFKASTAKSY